MKITIEIDDDDLFDVISEGASYNDKSVDRAKFNELVKWADFQEAVGAIFEEHVNRDLASMDELDEWIFIRTAKFDMFTSYEEEEK